MYAGVFDAKHLAFYVCTLCQATQARWWDWFWFWFCCQAAQAMWWVLCGHRLSRSQGCRFFFPPPTAPSSWVVQQVVACLLHNTKWYVTGFPVAQTMIKNIVCFTPASPVHLTAWYGFTLNGLSGGCASAAAAGTWASGALCSSHSDVWVMVSDTCKLFLQFV